MAGTNSVDPESEVNECTQEELRQMKTNGIGYVRQQSESEKKKIEELTVTLHLIHNQQTNKHILFAEDREEAKELQSQYPSSEIALSSSDDTRASIKRRELEVRTNRLRQIEELRQDMIIQEELQKKGSKRKLREDEIVRPNNKPMYKWRAERKR